MMARDFDAELRREEALRQAEGISADVRASIRARIERTLAARGETRGDVRVRNWGRTAAFAGVALAIAAAVLVFLKSARRLDGFELVRESADLSARVESGVVRIDRGVATLVDAPSGITLETSGPAALRREAGGVRVVRGRLNVSVEPRAPGASPVTVFVSHGAIEVMGTSFTVTQAANGGSVLLHEGSIRFRAAGHALVTLRPGEELSWPLSAEPSPIAPSPVLPLPPTSATSASPAPSNALAQPGPKPAPSARSAEELLNYVEELRSRRQFEAAARELSRGLGSLPAPSRERLSFELGSLLSHQIRDKRRACAHWAFHERQFPRGIYRDQVANARRVLGCTVAPSTP